MDANLLILALLAKSRITNVSKSSKTLAFIKKISREGASIAKVSKSSKTIAFINFLSQERGWMLDLLTLALHRKLLHS